MLKKCGLVIGLLVGCLVAPLSAQMVGSVGENVLEQVGQGEINWTLGTVRVTGIGAYPAGATNPVQAAAMAERAAITIARRNLLEIIKGVRVDSETTVESFVATSDVVKTKVRGFIQGARVVEKKTLSAWRIPAGRLLLKGCAVHATSKLSALICCTCLWANGWRSY